LKSASEEALFFINFIFIPLYQVEFDMKEYLRYAGYVLIILGLIGLISQTAPMWSVITVLLLGIVILVVTIARKLKK